MLKQRKLDINQIGDELYVGLLCSLTGLALVMGIISVDHMALRHLFFANSICYLIIYVHVIIASSYHRAS